MPQLGFEAAGSMVEKFLPGVNFPVLLNAVLPGALAAAALFPRVAVSIPAVFSLEIEKIWPKLVLYALVVVALGGLISSLNSEFYKIYEGRTFWPRWLKNWATGLQQKRVAKLYAKADVAKGVDDQTYNETWYKLRIYPIDKHGKRYANYPTLMGNILFGYEDYPKDRYGMDSIFYWPRLWLVVSKDDRKEIAESWSVADGLLNLSAVSLIAGVVWAATAAACRLRLLGMQHLPVANRAGMSAVAAIGWVLVAYFFYRLSLPFHRNNGEVFKSLFDLNRSKLKEMTELQPAEAEHWRAAWAYLQYLRVKCPCGAGYVSVYDEECSHCHKKVSEILEEFRRTGKLVAGPPPEVEPRKVGEILKELWQAMAKGGVKS